MWNIIGHRQTLAFFEHAQRSKHISHAYMFTGPAQVGKRTLALAFAQAIFCTAVQASPPDSPCEVCPACLKVQNGSHPDLSIILPDEGKKTVSIENIRAFVRATSLQPQESPYRIFLLPKAERLTIESLNTLLKTLEEPAPHTMLLLTTVDEQLLPRTIASRCQVLPVGLVNAKEMETALIQQWDISPERAQKLSILAAGRPGWAISASQHEELEEERTSWFQMMATLCESGPTQRIKTAAKILHDTERLDELLSVWLIWWRELLLASEGYQLPASQESSQRERFGKQIQPAEARLVIEHIQEAMRQLEQNANPRLVLETLLLELPALR
jgi:DNA polymerase-3 subunit delta'